MRHAKILITGLVCIITFTGASAQSIDMETYRWLLESDRMAMAAPRRRPAPDEWPRHYINIGWQFNAPVCNSFAGKASGWGAYLEGGHGIGGSFALGGFVSYGTNNEYIPRRTYHGPGGSDCTTDMQHSMFQVPFGLSCRYRLAAGFWQPHIGLKAGAEYAEFSSYVGTAVCTDKTWGFYVSPEIGFSIHPFDRRNLGFQYAIYYSYATNDSPTFGIGGLNNCGIRLGVAF